MSSPEDDKTLSSIGSELQQLKSNYESLLQERNRILAELSSLGEAFAESQRSRAELESALKRVRDSELSPDYGEATTTRIKFLEQEVESLARTYDEIESLLFRSLLQEPGVKEKAREFILKQGSLRYRVLLLVTERGSIEANEVMRLTGLDQLTLSKAIDILLKERAVEIHGSLLVVPGGLKLPEFETWRTMPVDKLFDEVNNYCNVARNPELVAQALQALKDAVEQRIRTRGTLFFEIGKEVQQWRRGLGNLNDLQFRINDWKQRSRQ